MKRPLDKSSELVRVRIYQNGDLVQLEEIEKDENIWEFYKLMGWTKAKDMVNWQEIYQSVDILYQFVIIDNLSNNIIGFSKIFGIDWKLKQGYIGSTFIHSDYWGKGHNQESKKIIIEFVFNVLMLEKLIYFCNVLNKRSYYAAFKLGFELKEVKEKARKNIDGSYSDFAFFELNK